MNPGRTGRQAMLILINIVVALLISQACKNSVDPSPAAIRALQWSEDIDYFGQELAARQKDFAQLTSVGQFNKSLENLKSEISSLEDAEIFLKLLEMVSALRVAHINIYPSPFDRFHLLPIVIQVFEDGVYIIQTTDEVPHLLGQRIIAVNGYPIETIMDSLQKMISYENQYWMKKQFSLIFNNSEMLKYYGFADSLLAFASFCGFAPKRCAVRRPQSKGKVERFIGYLTSDFLSQARLEGLKSAAQLNARIGSWLAEITEKKLRDFSESRQQRFAVERQYLQPLIGPDTFDCRDSHDVFVSREGFITFETNSYSVPPIYVGSRLVVKVDRINQEIEIVSNGQSIRTVPMLAPFSKSRYVAREDQIALLKVWQSQRNKPIAIPTSRKKSTVAVEIRQPAYYDALVCERGLS
jgi:hypothetical protein